ncbi:putative IS1 encoded domain protein [Shigella flexneri SFJ17B]|nr:putative IS1 encoded domain protein [Shigella flexneri SFJ17B]
MPCFTAMRAEIALMSGSAFAVTHHAFSSGAGRTSDGNGSHASTLKSPSYTKSVSWQHYPILEAHRCGINLIDTALGYNFGNSEVIVGQALKKLPREQVVVETKCGIVWERKGSLFNKVGDRQLYKNLSPESIREEVEASLQRLGIDYIDIYMTHWQSVPPFFTPIAETVAVLNELKAEGKIRAIGAANVGNAANLLI